MMIRNLYDLLHILLKQECKSQVKRQKTKLLIYDIYLKKYVRADELLVPRTTKDSIQCLESWNKSKNFMLFDLLLKKFINPKLDLLNPTAANIKSKVWLCNTIHGCRYASTIKEFWDKRPGNSSGNVPALPSSTVGDKSFGWAGQVLSTPQSNPRPEYSTSTESGNHVEKTNRRNLKEGSIEKKEDLTNHYKKVLRNNVISRDGKSEKKKKNLLTISLKPQKELKLQNKLKGKLFSNKLNAKSNILEKNANTLAKTEEENTIFNADMVEIKPSTREKGSLLKKIYSQMISFKKSRKTEGQDNLNIKSNTDLRKNENIIPANISHDEGSGDKNVINTAKDTQENHHMVQNIESSESGKTTDINLAERKLEKKVLMAKKTMSQNLKMYQKKNSLAKNKISNSQKLSRNDNSTINDRHKFLNKPSLMHKTIVKESDSKLPINMKEDTIQTLLGSESKNNNVNHIKKENGTLKTTSSHQKMANLVNRYAESNHSIAKNETSSPPNNSLESKLTPIIQESSLTYKSEGCHLKNCEENLDENLIETHKTPHTFNFSKNKKFIDKNSKNLQTIEFSENKKDDTLSNTEHSGEKLNDKARVKNTKVEVSFESTRNIKGKTGTSIEGNLKMSQDINSSRSNKDNGSEKSSENIVERRGDKEVGKFTKEAISAKPTGKLDKSIKDNSTIIQSSENKKNVAHSNTSEVNLEQSDNKDIAIKVAQEVVSVKPIENIKGNTETNIEGNFDISKTITSRSKKDIACNNTFENNKKAEKRGKEMNFKTTTNLEGNQEKIVKDNFRVPQIITGCDRKNGDSNENIFDCNIGRTVDKEIDKDTQKVVSFKNTEIVGDKSDVNGSENKQSIAHKSSLEKPSEGNKELTRTIHDLAVFETSENLETKSENNVEKTPKLTKTISDSHKTCVLNNNTLEKRDKEVNKTVTNFVNFKNIDFINKTAKNFNKIAEMKLDKSIKNNLKVSQASIGNNKNKVIYYDKSLQNSSKIRDKSTVKAVENVLGFETSGITNANYSNSNKNSGQTEAKKQEIEVIEDCKNSFNDGLSKKTVCELKNNKTGSQQDHTNTTDSINKIETINSNSLLCQATDCKAVMITQEKNQQDKNNFLDKMPANTMSFPTKVEQEISHKMARNKNTRPGENFENYTLDTKTLKGFAEMKKSKKAKQVSSIFNLNTGKIDKTFNKSREESNVKISKKVKNSNILGKDNTEKVQFKSNGIDPKYTDKLHAISAQGKQLEDLALDGDLNKFKVNNYRGFKIAKVKSDTQLTNQNSSVQSRLKRSLERNISHPRVKGSNTELINSSQSQTREKSQEFKKQAKTLTGPNEIFHQFKKPNIMKKVIPHKLCSNGLSRNINESKFTEKISTSPISGESKRSNSQESKNWISSKALPQNSTLLKESERQRKENDKSLSKNIDKPNNLNKSIMPKSDSTHGPYNIATSNSVPLPSKKLLVERNKVIKNIQGTIINENKGKIKYEIDKNIEAKNTKVQKEENKPQQSNKNTEEESFDSSTKVINKNSPKMNSLKENEDYENTEKPSSPLPKQSKRKIHLIENKVNPKIRHKYSRRKPMKPIKIFKYSGKKSRKLEKLKAVETKNIYSENKKESDSLKLINDEAETRTISNKKAKVLDKTLEPVSETQLHKQLRNKSVAVLSEETPDRKENKEKTIRKSKSVDSIKKANLDKYLRNLKKSAQRKKTKLKKPQSKSASRDKLTGKGISLSENTPDYDKKPEVSTSKKRDGYLNSKTKSRIYSQRSRKKTVIVGALKTRSSPELLNQIEETKNTMKSVSNDMSTKKRSISPQKQSKIRSYFEQRNKKPNGSSGIAHRGRSEFEKGNTVSSELEMKQTKTDEAIIDLKNNNITKTVFVKNIDDTGNVTVKEDVIPKYKEKLTNTSISSKFKDNKVIDSSENKDNENEPIKNGMDSGFKIKAVKSTSSVANKNQNSNETKASKRTSSLNKVNLDKTEQVSLIQEEKILNKYPHESISLSDKMLSKEMLNKRKSKSGKQNKTEETQMVISMKQSEPKPPTTQWKSPNQENKKLLNTTKNNTISRKDGNKSLAINMKPEERIKDLGDNSFSIKEIKKDGTKKSIALESYRKKHVKIPELNTNQENKPQDYNKVENESDELSGRLETKTIASNLNNANYGRIGKNRYDMFEYEKSDDIGNAFHKNPNPQGMEHGITILDSSKPQNNREQLIKVRDNKQKVSNALQPSTIEQFSKQQLIVEGNKIKTSSFNSQKAEFFPTGAEKGEGDKSKVLKKEISAKKNTTKLLNNMNHRLNRSTEQNIVKKSDTNSSNTELPFQKFTNNSIANKTDNAVKSVGEKKFNTVKNISQSSNKDKSEISTIKIVGTEKNMKMRNSYSDFKHKLNTPEEKKRIPLSKSQLKLKNETNESKNDLVLNNDKYFTNSKLLKKLSSTKSQIENNDLMVKGEVPIIDSSKRPSTAPGLKKYVTNIPSLNKPKIGGNLKLVKTKSHDDKNLKVNYVKSTGINILNSKVNKNESNGTAILKKEGEINNVNKTSSINSNISPDIKRKLSYLAKSALSAKFAIKETKLSLKKTGQLVRQNELAELKNDMFQGSEVIDNYSKVKIKEHEQEPSNIDKPHSRTKIQTTETLKSLKSAIVSPIKKEYLKERRKVFSNILKEDKINSTAKTKVQNGNQHEELSPKPTTLIMEDIVSNNIRKPKQAKTFSGDSILSQLSKHACSHLKNELVDSKINNNHRGEQGLREMEKDFIQNDETEQSINNLVSMKISKKHSSSTQNIHPDLVEKSANMPVMRKKKTEIKPPKSDASFLNID